jgi:c-di-GMP-binding flagellar brake protein YcgR
MEGVAMVLPQPAKPGSKAQVEFELYFNGKSQRVRAIARVAYCIFSNGQLRAGFQFTYIEPETQKAISQFVRSGT